MQVTLTKIYTTNKDKQGNELKSKKGVPYTRMSIKTKEHGEDWISGFQNTENREWKEGDTVEVIIEEKAGNNGVIYKNFSVPKKQDKTDEALEKIFAKLTSINLDVQIILEALGKSRPTNDTWGTLNSPNAKNNPNIPFSDDEGLDSIDIPY